MSGRNTVSGFFGSGNGTLAVDFSEVFGLDLGVKLNSAGGEVFLAVGVAICDSDLGICDLVGVA